MIHLNFNHLQYFTTIAKLGSIAKASKVLHLTQSTLSDQLRQLEEYFGRKLFERQPRKLILNDTGRIALDYANKIFLMTEEMEKAIQGREERRIVRLRVGNVPSLPKIHVHEFLFPIWKTKGIQISIQEGSLDYLIRELEIMNLDLILSDVSVQNVGTKFTNRHLISRKIIAIAHPKYKKAKANFPHSLNGLPFINFTEHGQLRYEIDQFFKRNDIHPDMIGEVDDINLARLSVEKGVGFALLPKNAAAESLQSGRTITLGVPKNLHSDMFAITPKAIKTHSILLKAIDVFQSRGKILAEISK